MKSLYFAFVFLLLAGCASGPRLDTSHPSANHDNRVQFVVVHYTSTNLERSLALLTHGEVSAHYLIRSSDGGQQQRAWAGALALITLVLILFTLARILGRPRKRGGVDEQGTVSSLAGLDAAFDRFHLSGEPENSMTSDTADHHEDRL